MTSDSPTPAWKWWHPVATWKMLLVFASAQVVCQLSLAYLFAAGLGLEADTGANAGAAVGGALAFGVVFREAHRLKLAASGAGQGRGESTESTESPDPG